MNVLMISYDRKVFEKGSAVRSRMIEYGKLFGELHIIVFSLKKLDHEEDRLSQQAVAYPTNSFFRILYGTDAVIIARGILDERRGEEWVVTTQDPFETGMVGYRLKKKYAVPLQVQVHTDFLNPFFIKESLLNRLRLSMARKVIPYADCIRVVSKRIKRSLEGRYKLPRAPLILPIISDEPNNAHKLSHDERTTAPPYNFRALIVARLEKVKNIELAIRAFATVVNHNTNAGLVIVGDGRRKSHLTKLVMKHNLSKNVVFEGWQKDVTSFYRTADVFLNTSNYEGYCRTLIEAAQAGCPIITTDVGIVGEVLNESNMFICSPGDQECFEKKIINTMNNRSTLATLSKKAKEDVMAQSMTKEQYLSEFKKSIEGCGKSI